MTRWLLRAAAFAFGVLALWYLPALGVAVVFAAMSVWW